MPFYRHPINYRMTRASVSFRTSYNSNSNNNNNNNNEDNDDDDDIDDIGIMIIIQRSMQRSLYNDWFF